MRLILVISILFSSVFLNAKIRLRKVKDAPRTCTVMKEDPLLSRANKKIFGTEKNSIVIDDGISLVGDLGHKLCSWPMASFTNLGEIKKTSFYIDEYKNILIAFQKVQAADQQVSKQTSVRQIQINIDNCQLGELKNFTEATFPKCVPPKSKKKSKAKAKTKKVK